MLLRRSFQKALLFPIFLLILRCAQPPTEFERFLASHPGSFDVLIKNGQVIDGTGHPAQRWDVLLRGDTIAYVGDVDTALVQVTQTIDAAGHVVTPGFIDTHAHGDPLQTPAFENFLAMGVTTIFLGQDGSSPAQRTLVPWMQQVTAKAPGVNIATFVGHGTLRELTGVNYDSVPTPAMLQQMSTLLETQLEEGAFGLSTGLEYLPGTYAPAYELDSLAKVVGRHDRVITSHMRNEDNDQLEASLQELIAQGAFCAVNASHLKAVYGKGSARAEEILAQLEQARANDVALTADLYPYTASYTGIGIVFPEWAKAPHDYAQVVRTRRSELAEYLRNKINQRNGPEATLFGTAPWAGMTLATVAREHKKPFEDVLIDDIGPTGASGAYFVMDSTLQERLLQAPYIMVCSDGSPTMWHPRGYGSFAKIIESYVQRKKLFSLEEAVRKMTSLPAQTFHLPDRGEIAAGKKADLLVFDPRTIRATATFTAPHNLAQGFRYVFVNGKLARQDETLAPQGYGQMLTAQ
ncbi:dihydroorotase/N-acyl-D-amino-acid deacylase [Catalinimonas alkaloidigena]|uniref:Dihydroorotase/N-acyl-D-amino-acid deacylase n=2 Tax=Catalinimonas alkaloidigena TaxID=1075417 RepID=A0A1G9PGE8_9BACT|nr:dihydroorotase/N-acyl-D-amino-acid deacylase [Catalinimonas alkaloidigena]